MYNKLFTKILDSSIWLESTPTRIVWLTMIAVMDENGFAQFAAIGNVANRARVTLEEAQAALATLESPDSESSDPENDGRRLERVPGGWLVLNADKHRKMVTRALIQEQTRERVQRHRAKLKRISNAPVTPSDTDTGRKEEAKIPTPTVGVKPSPALIPPATNCAGRHPTSLETEETAERAGRLVEHYGELYQQHRHGARHRSRPNLDWTEACDLVKLWDDYRLDKLATLILTTDDPWISNTDRAFKIFALKASWADDKLTAWEREHNTKA